MRDVAFLILRPLKPGSCNFLGFPASAPKKKTVFSVWGLPNILSHACKRRKRAVSGGTGAVSSGKRAVSNGLIVKKNAALIAALNDLGAPTPKEVCF